MACAGCAGKIAKGIKGLAKAALRIDRADPEFVQQRNEICKACPVARKCSKNSTTVCWCGNLMDGIAGKSTACGCFLPAKLRIKSETCPLNNWMAVEPSSFQQ
jgi:hypothetical protein